MANAARHGGEHPSNSLGTNPKALELTAWEARLISCGGWLWPTNRPQHSGLNSATDSHRPMGACLEQGER